MNLPFSGAKGGIAVDPSALSLGEKERLTRRFTEEVLAIIGPRMDVMAPDMGTDEQTMAWIMDTYSMKVGYACPEIVTGKPVEIGGIIGRREATGRGVVMTAMAAFAELGIRPETATAVVQGFGKCGVGDMLGAGEAWCEGDSGRRQDGCDPQPQGLGHPSLDGSRCHRCLAWQIQGW